MGSEIEHLTYEERELLSCNYPGYNMNPWFFIQETPPPPKLAAVQFFHELCYDKNWYPT